MNPGGLRADLLYDESGDEGDGVVTYAEAERWCSRSRTRSTRSR